MYILTQVLETSLLNLMKEQMNSFVHRYFDSLTLASSITHYRNLMEQADVCYRLIHQDVIRSVLESMDTTYRNSPERLKVAYVKDTRSRTLWTIFDPITFRRTIYQRRRDKTCFCYLDDYLGLPKYIKFDPMIRSLVCEAASNSNSLIKVGETIGRQCFAPFKQVELSAISRQSIRNILRHTEISFPVIRKKETPSTLYIMADEKYIAHQGNDGQKQMVKCAVVFENRDCSTPKRPVLRDKHHFVSMGLNFWEDFYDELSAKYDLDQVHTIYLMGDGARWIKAGVHMLRSRKNQHVLFLLDHFHYKQALQRFTKDEKLRTVMDTWFRFETAKDVKRTLLTLMHEDLLDSQLKTLNYLIKHIADIQRMFAHPDVRCSMEAKISHELASIFTSVPKAYSHEMLIQILALRMAYRNGYSIKSRSFFTLNTNENPIQTNFDYSIFDSNKTKGSFFPDPKCSTYFNRNYFNPI